MKIGKIEKRVPIPEVHSKVSFPWPAMEVGDSILVKAVQGEEVDSLKRKVKGSARYYGLKTGKRFRSLISREEEGVRVWRIN
ncbi:hypothetical protein PITCH_A450002 [uncultured Desulfobacterium sp.]|uniref:Uncharacterized protein n=1 Tax=uncultured Desulfobacterium sp. TaxID=201089 RepID=A0A445N092_9BACT|nr:hypothetical protein PITCH_A450002 [uncultured Desulfobacterium sp.]